MPSFVSATSFVEPRVWQQHVLQVELWSQPHLVPATHYAVGLVPLASDLLLSLFLPVSLASHSFVATS